MFYRTITILWKDATLPDSARVEICSWLQREAMEQTPCSWLRHRDQETRVMNAFMITTYYMNLSDFTAENRSAILTHEVKYHFSRFADFLKGMVKVKRP